MGITILSETAGGIAGVTALGASPDVMGLPVSVRTARSVRLAATSAPSSVLEFTVVKSCVSAVGEQVLAVSPRLFCLACGRFGG